ncbi:hypothetical protein ACES2L_00700 [Bdellovibrio bacteriovorus]
MKKKIWALVLASSFCSDGLAKSQPPSINNLSFVRNFSSSSTSLTVSSEAASLSKKDSNLIYIPETSMFVYSIHKKGKLVETYIKTDSQGNPIKVGVITHEHEIKFSENNCEPETHFDKLTHQIKAINDFLVDSDDQDLSVIIDQSCNVLSPKKKLELQSQIEKQFRPKDSYLMTCLNSKEAMDKINKVPAIKKQIPKIVDAYFIDLNKQKENSATFKVKCEKVESDTTFNAKYIEKEKAIAFPVKGEEIVQNSCLSSSAIFTHEYVHHAGIGNEKDVRILEAICAKANGLNVDKKECSSTFSMKDCLDKDPKSCYQAGIGAALQAAAADSSKKDRAAMAPALKEGLKDVKLDNVAVAPVQSSSQNNQVVAANQNSNSGSGASFNNSPASRAPASDAPSASSVASSDMNASSSVSSASSSSPRGSSGSPGGGGYDSSMQAIGVAMQRNMNKISSVVDKAYEATVSPAVAAEVLPSSASTSSSSSGRAGKVALSGSGKSDVQEYVVEEILADKYNVPVEQVRAIQRQEQGSPSDKPASDNNNRLSQSEVGPSTNAAASSGSSSSSGGIPSGAGGGFGYSGAQVSNGKKEAAKPAGRSIASIEPTTFTQKKEVMGVEYNQIRDKYDDLSFIRTIASENVRIEIPKEKRRIGSQNNDATIYIDTGRSLMRKR